MACCASIWLARCSARLVVTASPQQRADGEERIERQETKESATHLDNLVPSSRDNDGVHGVRRESNARDPVGVTFISNVELAVSERVPELDGSVS